MGDFKTVAKASEIQPGSGTVVDVDGNSIAVWNVGGNFFAFQNVCPHRGGPVGEGELEGNVITCPWHGWSFDLTTGVSPINPAAKLTRYDVKLEGDEVKVNL
jgi:nitrite reductase/ring-hydroxylating ferredoxin subunit